MNERIKQLLNEATSSHEQEHDKSKVMTVSDKEMKKFAELILFECIKIVVFNGNHATAEMIKEHFEVDL